MQKAQYDPGYFTCGERLTLAEPHQDWDIVLGHGPVIATAIHDGHAMRASLRPHLAVSDHERRREEDPLTGVLTAVGDVRIRANASRFQVDLNRPRDKALSTNPADTWGLRIWRHELPADELARSLAGYDRFYAMVTELIERMLARWDAVLLIDIHSYNHRRDGADAAPAAQSGNPDIELGVTTLDPARWGGVARRFAQALRDSPIGGHNPDVRENVRFPTGGYFPEWVYATWGERVCTMSPEYKKHYMDEWTGQADITVLEESRRGLQNAVDVVRAEFLACR